MSPSSREGALEDIVRLAQAHKLTGDEILAALEQSDSDSELASTGMLGRILGFLGGLFVFAGLGVFISLNWDSMNALARIIITLGSGIAVLVIAAVGQKQGGAERFTVPLFLIAALLQPVGILVAIDEFSSGGDWHYAAILAAGIMTVQQGAMLRQFRISTLVFTTMFFALWFIWVSLDLFGVDEDFTALLLGASTIGVCLGLEKSPYRGVNPFWYLFGAAGFFAGLFNMLHDRPWELIFIVAACGGVYLSVLVRSRTLLFASMVAALGYIGYFTSEYFLDSLGWPIMLIVLGFVLIGLSAAALRINRKYISP